MSLLASLGFINNTIIKNNWLLYDIWIIMNWDNNFGMTKRNWLAFWICVLKLYS